MSRQDDLLAGKPISATITGKGTRPDGNTIFTVRVAGKTYEIVQHFPLQYNIGDLRRVNLAVIGDETTIKFV